MEDYFLNSLKLFFTVLNCYAIQLQHKHVIGMWKNDHVILFNVYRMKRSNFSVVNKIVQSSPAMKQSKLEFYSSLNQTPMYAALPDWESLPLHVVLHIFQYLPLIDRARASSVCRRWNEVFHIPDLWRKFEFELNQPVTSYFKSTHPDLIQQIVKKHATHLQYVSFKVRRISMTSKPWHILPIFLTPRFLC